MLKILVAIGVLGLFNTTYAAQQSDYLSQLDKRYPHEMAKAGGPKFFDVPLVRKALDAAVPKDWQLAMKNELVVVTPNKLVEGHLVVSGCKPHFCPNKNYIASIRTSDGAALFIIFDDKLGEIKNPKSQCFSTTLSNVTKLPEAVRREFVTRNGISSVDESLACVSQAAFETEAPQNKRYLNISEFSENRQRCNLIAGVISIVPVWRDNQVPIQRAHRNIEDILIKISAEETDRQLWHKAVDRLYASKVSSKEMEAELHPMCEKIP